MLLHNLWFLIMGWTEANSYIPLRWPVRRLIVVINTNSFCSEVTQWYFTQLQQGRLFLEGLYLFTSVACLSKAFMRLILLVFQGMLGHVGRLTICFVTAWVISLATKISIVYNHLRLEDWKGCVRTPNKTCLKWKICLVVMPFPPSNKYLSTVWLTSLFCFTSLCLL